MKKGQGISVNMMILIVMGLIVLIISTVLVTKQFRKGDDTLTGATECPVAKDPANFQCVSANTCPTGYNQDFRTCSPSQICCKKA